jgi:hypothetical protein
MPYIELEQFCFDATMSTLGFGSEQKHTNWPFSLYQAGAILLF